MKTIINIGLIAVMIIPAHVTAYTQHNIEAANFLASQWIINDNSNYYLDYKLTNKITRREMLKVMMKLSEKEVGKECHNSFKDMNEKDWGCKYAEVALKEWFIAKNETFRPDDNISQIEALKMIMRAKGIEKNTSKDDWREWYVSKAYSRWLIEESYLQYDELAIRGWIFDTAARSFNDFEYIAPEYEIPSDVEKIFEELLWL